VSYQFNIRLEFGNEHNISVVQEQYNNKLPLCDQTLEQSCVHVRLCSCLSVHMHMIVSRYSIVRTCTFLLVDNELLMKRLEAYKFDLLVLDANFVLKCVYLIPHRLGIPFITYTDMIEPLLVRLPWLPSFVPNSFLTYSEEMSIFQRIKNTAVLAATSMTSIIPDPPAEILDDYRRLYGDFRSIDDLAVQSLLWLYPRDHLVDYAKPTMPHIVNVGGLTVKPSTGELAPEFRTFVDGAQNGTIIVSFGSIASGLPDVLIHKLLESFRRLDEDGYRFVFRMKTVDGFDIPQNVMTSSWIPQNELLGHEAVKLFITHCGNSGQYESVFQGQPMIGFPLFSDQHYNANRIKHKGFGIAMDFRTFTSEELVQNVRRIIADRSYKDRVVKAAQIFRDDPQTPAERAAYWIEHVCRFGGDHLRSASQDLPLYAYLMFDVLAFVLLVFVVATVCVWKLSKCIMNRCISKRMIPYRKAIKLS